MRHITDLNAEQRVVLLALLQHNEPREDHAVIGIAVFITFLIVVTLVALCVGGPVR